MRSPVAIITAGGYGHRLGCGMPKSLVACEGDPMIAHVLRSFAKVGVERFIIFNNRPEFESQLRKITSPFSAILLNDEGVDSTIALAQRALSHFPDDFFLFAYGHAPRRPSLIRKLIAAPGPVVATGVQDSSKASPIRGERGFWIEPPYRIERRTMENLSTDCWRDFFECVAPHIVPAMKSEPGEFNSFGELKIYSAYVRSSLLVESMVS